MNKVRLVVDASGIGHVWLNGTELDFVTAVKFELSGGNPAALSIALMADVEADIETENDPRVPTDCVVLDHNLSPDELEDLKREWESNTSTAHRIGQS